MGKTLAMHDRRIVLGERAAGGKTLLPDDERSQFLRNAFASGHINVLLGSAFSRDVVPTLGWREEWFQAVEGKMRDDVRAEVWKTASDLLRAEYFRSVMYPLRDASPTSSQKDFLGTVEQMVGSRGATTIPQRVNVFTTNYDPLIELALEKNGVVYNDGFSGRSEPFLDISSFSHLQYEQSLFMEYVSPVTTFNVLKAHGSLTWRKDGRVVRYSKVKDTIAACLSGCECVINLKELDTTNKMVAEECDAANLANLEDVAARIADDDRKILGAFRRNYGSILCLVNPAKSKFEETVLERCYYDLLRIYANELDRNNAFLLVSGFSFRDEHIRELTIRAARSNPRLFTLIACHTAKDANEYEGYFGDCANVYYLVPDDVSELDVKGLTGVLRWIAR